MNRCDAIVIGAGLAGCSAAIELARSGKSVVLLEKEAAPHHKVCGEFLSTEAQNYLRNLGLDLEALGAVPVSKIRLIQGSQTVENLLPFRAMSLSRFVLDEALLEIAISVGAKVQRGVTANGLSRDGTAWKVEIALRDGEHTSLTAPAVFLATGKHDLRGQSRPPGKQNNLIGFKMHFETDRTDWDDCVDLVMFKGGYAGVSKVEGGRVNVSLVIDKETYAAQGKDWNRLLDSIGQLSPPLAKRLEGAKACWPKPLAIFGIPYGFVQETSSEPGLYRLGDQVAVIPSFSGNGMSIALFSAALATQDYLAQSGQYNSRIKKALKRNIFFATKLSQMAIHPVFGAWLFRACKAFPRLITRFARRTRLQTNL